MKDVWKDITLSTIPYKYDLLQFVYAIDTNSLIYFVFNFIGIQKLIY